MRAMFTLYVMLWMVGSPENSTKAWLGFLVIACFRYCQPLVANVQ
ncbi:hypothetical protein RJ639_021700, partial [Escallonia herrerae]